MHAWPSLQHGVLTVDRHTLWTGVLPICLIVTTILVLHFSPSGTGQIEGARELALSLDQAPAIAADRPHSPDSEAPSSAKGAQVHALQPSGAGQRVSASEAAPSPNRTPAVAADRPHSPDSEAPTSATGAQVHALQPNGAGQVGGASQAAPSPDRAPAIAADRPSSLDSEAPSSTTGARSSDAARAYSFKTYPPGSQAANWRNFTVGQCFEGCGVEDGLAAERDAIPSDFPVLLLIGQEKAGTSWFYNLLAKQPGLATAEFLEEPERVKETHWFDQGHHAVSWKTADSATYIRLFTKGRPEDQRPGTPLGGAVALDGTPIICDYEAAPRVAAMAPHARFVVILRDPLARLISNYRMIKYGHPRQCDPFEQGGAVPPTCFLPAIDVFLEDSVTFAEQNPDRFYPTPASEEERRSFPEWICANGGVMNHDHKLMCSALIGPQLAWWLAFFPPERFLIFTSDQLRNTAGAKVAAQKVLEHAGVHRAKPITDDMLKGTRAFVGEKPDEPDISHLVLRARALFERPMAELTALINEHWPELEFTGVPDEF